MTIRALTGTLLLAAAACDEAAGPPPCEPTAPVASGFYGVHGTCGAWTLVAPDGAPFVSVGVNSITAHGTRNAATGAYAYHDAILARYGSDEAWGRATGPRLRGWGFNTAGGWSQAELLADELAVTAVLYLGGGDWQTGDVADWFDPGWEAHVRARVEQVVTPWVGDPRVLGWFLDNEMRWGPDWRGPQSLLALYLALPADAPGKAVAVDALLAVDPAAGARAELLARTSWGELPAAAVTRFLEQAAERYFATATAILRARDPDHLVLGNRDVSYMTRAEVWQAAARHVDVLSVNYYVYKEGVGELALNLSGGVDPAGWLRAQHELTGKPLLISEFGFRAADSLLPNSWPPVYPTLATQADRADAYDAYVTGARGVPWIVGTHWFEWADQPAEGRFDGEDNNWGLVNEADDPYTVLVERMTAVNAR
jgi:hypothetical protein